MHFTEEFLYFIWQFRLFKTKELYCSGGQRVQILSPGLRNTNAGPDFSHAKILLDGTMWVGNVEMHLLSSDWNLHGHQNDKSYESVILHVVYEHDCEICREDGSKIPVIALKDFIDGQLVATYNTMVVSATKFPCERQIGGINDVVKESFYSRLIVERFEQKSAEVFAKLDLLKGNWEETFYFFLARNFGFKVNAVPFELLAGSLPQHIFLKNKDDRFKIDALIFGQAGFLNQEFEEDYPNLLKKEYSYLKTKYRLTPLESSLWKFLRMRPQNFPTVRLAQFSSLIASSNHLFSKILAIKCKKGLIELFQNLPIHQYWTEHYHFSKKSEPFKVQLGSGSIQNIIINTVCVFLFAYGRYTDQEILMDQAISLLEEIPTERNSIITNYLDAGIKVDNSFVSQALLQLNKCYCSQKKCLNCVIGVHILKK